MTFVVENKTYTTNWPLFWGKWKNSLNVDCTGRRFQIFYELFDFLLESNNFHKSLRLIKKKFTKICSPLSCFFFQKSGKVNEYSYFKSFWFFLNPKYLFQYWLFNCLNAFNLHQEVWKVFCCKNYSDLSLVLVISKVFKLSAFTLKFFAITKAVTK